MMDVIIVEDEIVTSLFLEDVLEGLGHSVASTYSHADDLLQRLKSHAKVDLIFMDINIKGSMDGIALAKQIADKYPHISIIFVTAYKDSPTINEAQSVSPIGYLIKPILKSHIEAMMMVASSYRTLKQTTSVYENFIMLGKYSYDTQSKALYLDDTLLELTFFEVRCIDALIQNKNSYISAKQFMHAIWGEEKSAASLRELIYRLRKKVPNIEIQNIPNRGYKLQI